MGYGNMGGVTTVSGPPGPQGPQGASGVISVVSPITNTGTSTAANIGIDQTLLTITQSQVTNLTTDLAAKAPLASPTFTGTVTIPAGSSISGVAYLDSANTFTNNQQITAPTAASIPLTVKLAATATGDSFRILASTDAVQFRIYSSGAFSRPGGLLALNEIASDVVFRVRGFASQTANLEEWQNSSGTVLAQVLSNGQFAVTSNGGGISNGTTNVYGARQSINTVANGTIGLVIRAAGTGQTANLQEWQNSAGTVLATVSSGGRFGMDRASVGNNTFTGVGTLSVYAGSASTVGVVIRAAASQTANLQEWQNSAGTVVAKVDSAGVIFGSALRTGASYGLLTERNSGAELTLLKQTAQTTSPGTGYARLYFRDGTNAGTLKLVVRAGSAGAETTILDNIPQT